MSTNAGGDALRRYVASLRRPISAIRLESYRPTPVSDDLAMLTAYLWNVALAEALVPALQGVEIALRNSLSAGLAVRYGSEEWYDRPYLLGVRQQRAVASAKQEVLAAKGSVSAGRVIAELHFWFWISLLSRHYHHVLWQPSGYELIDIVFPEIPKRFRSRNKIHARYDAIRLLRNRVFHFEPLWNRPRIYAEHDEMLDALSWISPVMCDTVRLIDRFDDVHTHGRARIEGLVRARVGR